jgi:sulfonate transport system permease protein
MKRTLPWIVPVAILLLWQAASQLGLLADQIMPAPTAVARAFWRLTRSGELLRDIGVSSWRGRLAVLLLAAASASCWG